jgi:hypothetical protein
MTIAVIVVADPINPTELTEWFTNNPNATILSVELVMSYVFYVFYS